VFSITGTKADLITFLKENPKYTKDDLVRLLDKADGTIKEHLADLKRLGIIERIGGRKEGYWKVIEE